MGSGRARQDGPITIRTSKGDKHHCYWHYRVAETDICADMCVIELEPYAVTSPGQMSSRPQGASPANDFVDTGFRAQTRGLIGRGECDVVLEVHPEALHLAIDANSYYSITRNTISFDGPGRDAITEGQALSGICLILALALRRIFVLHASAVLHNGAAIAFAGDSGAGKSTLAAHAESASMTAFKRLADDLLPLCLDEANGISVRPSFPQLKLTAGEQTPSTLHGEYPLKALVLVNPLPRSGRVAVRELRGQAAIIAVLRHTVASRLFPPALHRLHMPFATTVAARVPVFMLDYPHTQESPDQIYDLIGSLVTSPATHLPDCPAPL